MSSELLKSLGLDAINAGTYLGNGEWSSATSGELITPVNPTTGEPIAQVRATTEAEYETVVARAQEAFKIWRTTPAPRRGEAVRLCGEALRKHKDALGSLVALEMGKSKPEGDGEVQEMIDIADFAVGQSRICTTTRRLIVHRSIYADVLATLVKAYKQVEGKIGDPTDAANLMGPLNSDGAVQQFLDAIAQAKAAGGTIETGGTRIDRAGNFVLPAIVSGLKNSDAVVQHETFAPILYVMPYDSIDEAIDMQNGVPQGLSSSIFTQNLKTAEKFLSAAGSDCGIANINIGTSGAEIGGAFGGEKDTGGGRESGSDAWKVYMRRQTNTINYSDSLPLAQGIKFDL